MQLAITLRGAHLPSFGYTAQERTHIMDIRELRYIVTLSGARTFGQAADALHVSRQAVAKTLRDVERQAGCRLFERGEDGLQPTEEGRLLIDDAQMLLADFDALCAKHFRTPIPEADGEMRRETLSIALVTGGSIGLPDNLFENFLAAHHGIAISVDEMNSDTVLASVKEGNSDIGVLGTHPDLVSAFDAKLLKAVGVWVVVPQDHPLADRASIGLADLDGQTMVTAGPHNHLHRFVIDRCLAKGVKPNVQAHATEGDMIRRLAQKVGGMFFTFPSSMNEPPPGTRIVKVDVDGGDEFGTYAVRRKGGQHSHAARLFWSSV